MHVPHRFLTAKVVARLLPVSPAMELALVLSTVLRIRFVHFAHSQRLRHACTSFDD